MKPLMCGCLGPGTSVIPDASGSSDPDGMPLSFEWDLDNDGAFDGSGGPTAVFD